MIIPFRNLTGEFPRTDKHLLPENAAQSSQDCDFTAGTLRGLKLNSSGGRTYYQAAKSLFYTTSRAAVLWGSDNVDACNSPVVNDAYGRFYWADGTQFVVTQTIWPDGSNNEVGVDGQTGAPGNSKWIGVPAPNALAKSAGKILLEGFSNHGVITAVGHPALYEEDSTGARNLIVAGALPLGTLSLSQTSDDENGLAISFYAASTSDATVVPALTSTWQALGPADFGMWSGTLYGISVGTAYYYAAKVHKYSLVSLEDDSKITLSRGDAAGLVLTKRSASGDYYWYSNAVGLGMPT